MAGEEKTTVFTMELKPMANKLYPSLEEDGATSPPPEAVYVKPAGAGSKDTVISNGADIHSNTVTADELPHKPGLPALDHKRTSPETNIGPANDPLPKIPEGKTDSKVVKAPKPGADNSCITFMANLGIVILMIINTGSLLLGIALVVAGSWLRSELSRNDDILQLMDLIDFGTFTLRTLVFLIITIIIVLGSLAIVTSLAGAVGAFFAFRIVLVMYTIVVAMVIILEITLLALWIDFLNKVNSYLQGQFEEMLMEYTGFNDYSIYTLGWDAIFLLFSCCGVSPVTSSYNDFRALPSAWWSSGSRGSDVIPFACCKDATIYNYLQQNNTVCTENLIGYHKAGCYDEFDDIFTMLGDIAISITSILLVVEVIAIFFSVIIVYAVTKKKKVGII